MHLFTERSIELANQRNYLDLLFAVYPLRPDYYRQIDSSVWHRVEESYNNQNNKDLIQALLDLKLFPIKDGYVPYLRHDRNAILRNPETVNRICGRVREMTLGQLWDKCSQPKETNRQMGPLFRNWIQKGTLGFDMIQVEHFNPAIHHNVIILGSDQQLREYAENRLGYSRDKGIDLMGYIHGKYVIGEAKFITDDGGHQNGQFADAISTVQTPVPDNVECIAILDGILYIPSKKKMYVKITTENLPVMSALVLRDYLYTI